MLVQEINLLLFSQQKEMIIMKPSIKNNIKIDNFYKQLN